MRCEHLEGAPEKWRLCARIENEREGDHGHGAQFRREGVPGFQTRYPVTMDTSNAARASNLKYDFRRFSPPPAARRLLSFNLKKESSPNKSMA